MNNKLIDGKMEVEISVLEKVIKVGSTGIECIHPQLTNAIAMNILFPRPDMAHE